jgi:hypothetical protein
MRMTDDAASLIRGAYTYPVIVFALLASPGCGSREATKTAPSPMDGKAARDFFANAPEGFGPNPKEPLGKSIVDVPAPIAPRRRKP